MSDNQDRPIQLGNEFSQVVVERVRTRNGARLRISVPASGREVLLCPLELEALTWAGPEVFSRLLATPHGPEHPGPSSAQDEPGEPGQPGHSDQQGDVPRRQDRG